jgi:hypothetical protein
MVRLDNETWKNIFRNIQDDQLEQAKEDGIEDLIKDGVVERIEVEVVWLDSTDEWCICSGYELFEDGFDSEKEAMDRLHYLENILLPL